MKLLILLRVKGDHQAKLAIDSLCRSGAHLPPVPEERTLPLGRVCAIGAGEDGIIQVFFAHMDTQLPDSEHACHVYEYSDIDDTFRQRLVNTWQHAAHVRNMRTIVAMKIKALNDMPVSTMDITTLNTLFAGLHVLSNKLPSMK
ncbi:MAG: hypothetical protein CMK03_12950 [Ponticaulis sp.]|nr:hypothetical protein [Ponticaulis sp.]